MEIVYCYLAGRVKCVFSFYLTKITLWIVVYQVCLQLPQSALCFCSTRGSLSQLSSPWSGKCFEYMPMITAQRIEITHDTDFCDENMLRVSGYPISGEIISFLSNSGNLFGKQNMRLVWMALQQRSVCIEDASAWTPFVGVFRCQFLHTFP